MGSNVEKINLEELRKAREALNSELGISNPAPAKKSKLETENDVSRNENTTPKNDNKVENKANTSKTVEIIDDESENDKDFSVYDNFSQFEINTESDVPSVEGKKAVVEEEVEEDENLGDFISMLEEYIGSDMLEELPIFDEIDDEDLEETEENLEENAVSDSEMDFEKILEELDSSLLLNEENDSVETEDEVTEPENSQPVVEPVDEPKPIAPKPIEKPEEVVEIEPVKVEEPKPIVPKPIKKPEEVISEKPTRSISASKSIQNPEEVVTAEPVETVDEPKQIAPKPIQKPEEIVVDVPVAEEPKPIAKKSIQKPDEVVIQQPTKIVIQSPEPVEIDYARRPSEARVQFDVDMGSELYKVEEEIDPTKYMPKIEDKKFIDIIRAQSFMGTDNFTCIYGIQEDGNVFCQNFKDFYNTIVFSENDDNDGNVFNLFSSIIMSLLLKNSKYDINFAICDAKNGGPFSVYNDLSYMFFDKVAESNRDIIHALKMLTKEIDRRYESLAKANAKSIEKFNDEMKKAHIAPMPNIILFFNNYSRAVHLDDSNEIDMNLSYILRFGRLVGVNVYLVAFDENLADSVNYNLQTRMAFKTELAESSVAQIGESGAETIGYNDEYVVKTLYSDKLIHLKPTNITQKEIELLIKNIEK